MNKAGEYFHQLQMKEVVKDSEIFTNVVHATLLEQHGVCAQCAASGLQVSDW